MRVVTWNLLWRFGNWRERQPAIVATLEGLRPDVAGLQEVWVAAGTSQAEVLAQRLGMHSAVATPSLPRPPSPPGSPDLEGIDVGVALLSRWPIRSVRRQRLPSANRVEPVALLATLDHPVGALHVVVACVEWEPELAEDHLAQTRALAALLRDPALDGPLPVLLTADLNAGPDGPEVRALTEVLVDTWAAGGGDPDAVTLSSKNPLAPLAAVKQIDRRVDYILARPGTAGRPVAVRRAFLADTPVAGVYPSDHDAVVADLAHDDRPCATGAHGEQ
jgi:endonuclease/exonuclease/phosphatase family metal-dependent hydrolase